LLKGKVETDPTAYLQFEIESNPADPWKTLDPSEGHAVLPMAAADESSKGLTSSLSGGRTCPDVKRAVVEDQEATDENPLIGVLIEYCCAEDSQLCDESYAQTPSGRMLLVRLTQQDDLTTKEGLDYAMRVAGKYRHLPIWLWSSIPCTGGSPIQELNKRHRNHRRKMAAHIRVFRKLHANLISLADFVKSETIDGHLVSSGQLTTSGGVGRRYIK